jgi:hypothetical protein
VGNATNALQSPLNLHHRINTILTSAFGAKSFGAEDKPGDQVIRNDLMGAQAGALKRPGVNELRDRSVEFKFSWYRASGATGWSEDIETFKQQKRMVGGTSRSFFGRARR